MLSLLSKNVCCFIVKDDGKNLKNQKLFSLARSAVQADSVL